MRLWRKEVSMTKINISCLEVGFFSTNITIKNAFNLIWVT